MPDLVALHGFTQRGSAFEELGRALGSPIEAPDLPGHGEEPVEDWNAVVDGIAARLGARPAPPILLGYSMGGRLALGVAVRHPDAVAGLVVVSAGPGIASPAARARRREEDEVLARRLEERGVEPFLDEWLSAPMFAGLAARGERWQAADRARRGGNSARGLAAALRRLGQGVMPDLRSDLGVIPVPVLLMTGERDLRYGELAVEMAGLLREARCVVVAGAHHPVVGERPEAVAELVLDWAG